MVYDARTYRDLANRVGSGDPDFLKIFLDKHSELDITHADGKFLRLAIEGNDANVKITRLLINYFNRVQLPKLTAGSFEYNILKYRFKTALETAVEDETLSTEMKELLSPYIDFEGSKCNDLDDDEVSTADIRENYDHNHATYHITDDITQDSQVLGQVMEFDGFVT